MFIISPLVIRCVIFQETKTVMKDGNVAGSEISIGVGDAAGDIHI